MREKQKKKMIWASLAVLILGAFLVVGFSSGGTSSRDGTGTDVALFSSPTCGCCEVYSEYLDGDEYYVDAEKTNDMQSIKQKHDIPSELESCHTSEIGDYFVEGHIPQEAIDKLMEEQPDIAGIALPGMPQGTPGMPGPKREDWTIYAVGHDGEYEEFMVI